MEPKVTFDVTRTGMIRALFEGGGFLESQTVEAHLLYAILHELENLSAK